MPGPVPAAVGALDQASSAPLIMSHIHMGGRQQYQGQTTLTETANRFHSQVCFMRSSGYSRIAICCWQNRDVCACQKFDAGAGSTHVSVQGHVC
ncbi:TPA: hypothetical protein ACH3X3_002039 [Trebouxia sp. C0006]